MKINTKLHGVLDYFTALLLVASPWFFEYAGNNIQTWISLGVGITVVLNILFTDFEFGIIRVLKMESHLAIDMLCATILLTASWILNVSQEVMLFFLVISIFQAALALATRNRPYSYKKTNNFHRLKIMQ